MEADSKMTNHNSPEQRYRENATLLPLLNGDHIYAYLLLLVAHIYKHVSSGILRCPKYKRVRIHIGSSLSEDRHQKILEGSMSKR